MATKCTAWLPMSILHIRDVFRGQALTFTSDKSVWLKGWRWRAHGYDYKDKFEVFKYFKFYFSPLCTLRPRSLVRIRDYICTNSSDFAFSSHGTIEAGRNRASFTGQIRDWKNLGLVLCRFGFKVSQPRVNTETVFCKTLNFDIKINNLREV